jgi:hypothetical protein
MERILILAEIADKMPTLTELAVIAAVPAAVAGIARCYRRWMFAIVAIPVLAFLNLGSLLELRDPSFGGAVWHEMGSQYVYGTFFAINVPFGLAVALVTVGRLQSNEMLRCSSKAIRASEAQGSSR